MWIEKTPNILMEQKNESLVTGKNLKGVRQRQKVQCLPLGFHQLSVNSLHKIPSLLFLAEVEELLVVWK